MSELALKEKALPDFNYSLDEGLNKLCEYGKPTLWYRGNGQWYCSLEMYVQGKGISFTVASEFTEISKLDAVRVCYERLAKALKDLGLSV